MEQLPQLPGIPGGEPAQPPPRRWVAWIEFVVAIALMLFFALAVLGFVIDLTSSKHVSSGLSKPAQFVVAAICAGIAALCVWWARRAEHRIRHREGHPAALALEAEHQAVLQARVDATPPGDVTPPSGTKARPTRFRPRGSYGPTAAVVNVVIFGLGTLGMVAWAFATHADGQRSTYVQHHGIPAVAVVAHVNNIESCGRSSCSYHAKISARLLSPVRGATSTVVNFPEYSDLQTGQQVRILVDPKELGYAEFRGEPSVSSWQWIVVAAFALIVAGIEAIAVRALLKVLARRREHRWPAGAPEAVPAQ